MPKQNRLHPSPILRQDSRQTIPFEFRIAAPANGERTLHIRSTRRGKGELIIARDHAYDFMEQVIHFVAALNKANCESS